MIDLPMMFAEYRLSMVFLLAFQLLFLPLRYKKGVSLMICTASFGISGIMEYFIFFVDISMGCELSLTVLEIIVVQATAFMLCRYRDARALFTGISSAAYVLPGNVFFMGLTAVWGGACWILFAAGLFHLMLLFIIIVFMRRHYLGEMESYSGSWSLLCLIPALFYAVTYTLTCWPNSIYKTKEIWLGIFLILLLMEATYVLMIKLISRQRIENDLERSNEFLETYALGLRREAEVLRSSEEKMQLLRHDSRHVYRIIRVYLEEGKTEQIKDLLDQMDTELQSFSKKRFCENITVNGILSGSDAKARKEKVEFICQADVPKKLESINEFELATVISNLLDNAIYAAKQVEEQGERKVVMRIFPVKGQLVLEITNTFVKPCEFSSVTGLPLSTKGKGHGYGMRSVQAFANKHRAIFRYSVEDGRFCVRLLTNL